MAAFRLQGRIPTAQCDVARKIPAAAAAVARLLLRFFTLDRVLVFQEEGREEEEERS